MRRTWWCIWELLPSSVAPASIASVTQMELHLLDKWSATEDKMHVVGGDQSNVAAVGTPLHSHLTVVCRCQPSQNSKVLYLTQRLKIVIQSKPAIRPPLLLRPLFCDPNCKSPLIFFFKNSVNPATPLIQPNFHGPMVAVIMALHCNIRLLDTLTKGSKWWFELRIHISLIFALAWPTGW